MARNKWDKKVVVKATKLAKTGMPNSQIAKVVGVSPATFQIWVRKHTDLADALHKARGRKGTPTKKKDSKRGPKSNARTVPRFTDYIYQQLDEPLQKLWNKIMAFDKAPNGYVKIEQLLKNKGKNIRQNLFVHAWISSGFKFTVACRRSGVSFHQFTDWKENDPDFLKLITAIDFHKGNFFEEALIDLVNMRDSTAIVFANRTYNRKRGYNEKVDLNFEGELDIKQKVDFAKLSIAARKELLAQLREKK